VHKFRREQLSGFWYNMAKIREQDTVQHWGDNGRSPKLTTSDNIAIGQWIRRDNEITAKEIVQKL